MKTKIEILSFAENDFEKIKKAIITTEKQTFIKNDSITFNDSKNEMLIEDTRAIFLINLGMNYQKLLVIFVIVLFSFTLSAQIKVHSYFESGYENRTITANESGIYTMNNSLFSTFNLSTDYKGFSLYTNTKTFYKPIRTFYNSPKQIEFYIGAKFTFKKFIFGFEHLCSHSIESVTFYDAYDRISIKFNIL